MWPAVARHLICPLHERLLHRHTFRYLRALEWSQWLAPDEIHTLQQRKLTELLRHARANVPYYRARLADLDPDQDEPFEGLRQLPLLEKDDIRDHLDDLLWRQAPGGLFPHNTGGSTGEPLVFYFDRRRQGYDQAARIRTHRWFNVDLGDRELYLWGSPIELSRRDRLKTFRDGLFNHRLISAFDMSPERMDRYLDAIERYRPACLFGYPSSVHLLVEHARSRGRLAETRELRAVFVTGEFLYPEDRKAIEEYFEVPAADCYGSREGGFIAHECPEGGLHITAENVIVEILRDGSPAGPDEDGEIVITHLDAYAMPFIRYRTGDVGRLRAGRCRCGRGLPMMDMVAGRQTDFLCLPDGTVRHALSIIYPLREQPSIRRFRVVQAEDLSISITIVPQAGRNGISSETIRQCVLPVVGKDVAVEVCFAEHIPVNGAGKFRYVESRARPRRQQSIQRDAHV